MVEENQSGNKAVAEDEVEDEAEDEDFEDCKARLACRIKLFNQMTELKSLGISLYWLMCSSDADLIDLHQ